MKRIYITLFSLMLTLIAKAEVQSNEYLRKGWEILYTNPTLAIHYGEQILSKKDKTQDRELIAETYLLLAQSEKLLGDFDTSLKHIYEALDICPSGSRNTLGQLYLHASFTYSTIGDHVKAIDFNEKATALYKVLSDSLKLADCYNTRGLIHCNLHEFPEAEQFFQKSLALNRKFKNLKAVAANLNNLSLYEGILEEKLGYLNEAITINKNLLANWALGENYNNTGKQYYFAGNYTEALHWLKQAREVAEQIESKELICDNFEYLSWVYYEMKDYKRAYDCQSSLLLLRQ